MWWRRSTPERESRVIFDAGKMYSQAHTRAAFGYSLECIRKVYVAVAELEAARVQ